MLSRFLLVAAAAVASLASASDLTGFGVDYDILSVTVSHEVELVKELAKPFFPVAEAAYKKLLIDTSKDIKSGKLTWNSHTDRLDQFYTVMDMYSPFSSEMEKTFVSTPIYFFAFTNNQRAASWDVMYYGASKAAAQYKTNELTAILNALDKDMEASIYKTSKEANQQKVDAFFEAAEEYLPNFSDLAFEAVEKLYKTVVDDVYEAPVDDDSSE